MTNLEAANLLDNLIGMVSDNHDSDYDEALSKGRDILKSEPCEDAISRADAVKVASGYCHPQNIANELAKLPSVTPQPKIGHWIAVSERLPKENGEYLVTVKRGYVVTGLWVGNAGYWNEVIAWMPLPEPYKPQESEDKE